MEKIKKIFLLCTVSLFTLCVNVSAETRPLWIDNPSMRFSEGDIYAVGTGSSLDNAKSNARAEILKYFEVSINSKFSGNLTASDSSSSKLTKEEIEETTNGIIKGINITSTYKEKDGEFYALAVLDKAKVATELDHEIDNLDAKMQVLLEDGSAGVQLEKMYLKREELNKKYLFLTGKSITPKVKYGDVFKKTKSNKKLSFYISFPQKEYAPALNNRLVKAITDNGYVVSSDIERAGRVLKVSVLPEEQYMNVAGFVKYKVNFKIETKGGSKTLGTIAESYTETGRSAEQIYSKTADQFSGYLEENIQTVLK